MKNTIFADKTFADCSLLQRQRTPRPQISRRKLSKFARSFLLRKVSRYTCRPLSQHSRVPRPKESRYTLSFSWSLSAKLTPPHAVLSSHITADSPLELKRNSSKLSHNFVCMVIAQCVSITSTCTFIRLDPLKLSWRVTYTSKQCF